MSRVSEDPQPGIPAKYASECQRCGLGVRPGDRIVFRRGHPIHVGCASGGDDQ